MNSHALSFVLWLSAAVIATAIPEISPYPPVEFTGTIDKIVDIRAGEPSVVVRIKDYEGIDDATSKKLYKALRHMAKLRVKHPSKRTIEVVFPKRAIKGLSVGDRVRVSGYCILGHSESRGASVSDSARIVKE